MEHLTAIYAAELAAVQLAVNWLLEHISTTKAVILSDSLSIVTSLQSQSSLSHPIAMARLLESISNLETQVVFAWVPSHVGVRGNEIVDQIAKDGRTGALVELNVPREIKDEFVHIDMHIQSLWQQEYNHSKQGAAYRALESAVSEKVKFSHKNRNKETKLTRLRLGKCSLKKYLHDIKAHPDGLCSNCQLPETIEHLLIDCTSSQIPMKLRNKCSFLNIQPNLVNILSTTELLDLVYDLVLEHNITL